jgi:hypothetical protein
MAVSKRLPYSSSRWTSWTCLPEISLSLLFGPKHLTKDIYIVGSNSKARQAAPAGPAGPATKICMGRSIQIWGRIIINDPGVDSTDRWRPRDARCRRHTLIPRKNEKSQLCAHHVALSHGIQQPPSPSANPPILLTVTFTRHNVGEAPCRM